MNIPLQEAIKNVTNYIKNKLLQVFEISQINSNEIMSSNYMISFSSIFNEQSTDITHYDAYLIF